jgi:hypothetical protein
MTLYTIIEVVRYEVRADTPEKAKEIFLQASAQTDTLTSGARNKGLFVSLDKPRVLQVPTYDSDDSEETA